MRHDFAAPGSPVFVCGHGAGAGHSHPWMRAIATGLSARGIHVVTFDFPYVAARRTRPDPGPVLEAAFAEAWKAIHDPSVVPRPAAVFAGGKSMGGRIASQAAAKGLLLPAPAGLVFFGYPLHPPHQPGKRRDAHLPTLRAPILFVQGSGDPFGNETEIGALVATLPSASLHLVRGGDHSLKTTKRDDPNQRGLEDALDRAAAWMLDVSRGLETA